MTPEITDNIVKKLGSDLKPGDVMIPWFDKRAIIGIVKPYKGRLDHLFPNGASVAFFKPHSDFIGRMTIDHGEYYKVVEE